MGGDARQSKKIVEGEVAVADGIQAVGGELRESEVAGDGLAVDGEGAAGDGPGTHGTGVRALRSVVQTLEVAGEGFGVGQKKVREQDGLSVLHVSHASHGNLEVGFGLDEERADERANPSTGLGGGFFYKQAKIGGDQFVAAATGMEFPAERAKFFDQGFFHEVMNVFGLRT